MILLSGIACPCSTVRFARTTDKGPRSRHGGLAVEATGGRWGEGPSAPTPAAGTVSTLTQMATRFPTRSAEPPATNPGPAVPATVAATMPGDGVLAELGSTPEGLSEAEATRRLASVGPNAVRSHGARWGPVLVAQLRSPLLVLLTSAAVASYFVGERTDAVIIGAILALSVGLGFVNEYRAETRRRGAALADPATEPSPGATAGRGGRRGRPGPRRRRATLQLGDVVPGRPAAARRSAAWSATRAC